MSKKGSWQDPSRYLKEVHVAEEVAGLDYTETICRRAGLPVTIVPSGSEPAIADPYHCGKRHLFLCHNKGDFLKSCPGTQMYRCCGYEVLNVGMNCPMDCVYCILQAYLNHPWLSAFVNTSDLFTEIDTVLREDPHQFHRIGTGEFSDSLALERLTGMGAELAALFSRCDNAVLELKTKSGFIDTLEDVDHRGRTLLSWSLNSPKLMKSQEIRTASLEERLEAARRAASWGYGLTFHFDPIIYHHDWRRGYEETIDLLFNTVPREAIVWISLGALRYLPPLKQISTTRFPGSPIFREEFVTGLDGKMRYFRGRRLEMYHHIYTCLRRKASEDTCIYFCMESDEIWHDVFGFIPQEQGGIAAMLDAAARRSLCKY